MSPRLTASRHIPRTASGRIGLGELIDRKLVAVIQRLVQLPRRVVMPPGQGDRDAVQFVIGAVGDAMPNFLSTCRKFRRWTGRCR